MDPNNLKDYIPHPFHMINGDNVKRELCYMQCEHMTFRSEGTEILVTEKDKITLPLSGELIMPAKVSAFIRGGTVKWTEIR